MDAAILIRDIEAFRQAWPVHQVVQRQIIRVPLAFAPLNPPYKSDIRIPELTELVDHEFVGDAAQRGALRTSSDTALWAAEDPNERREQTCFITERAGFVLLGST
ncbi:MAG TPA: hypothetical protein VF913_02645 [Xanthobacteraceae bacterium]